MEKLKGYQYTVNSDKNVEGFALCILQLANIKSSSEGVVYDFSTVEGTNLIKVVVYEEKDSNIERVLKSYGEIQNKVEVAIVDIEFDDFKKQAQETLKDLEDEFYNDKIDEYYVGYELL